MVLTKGGRGVESRVVGGVQSTSLAMEKGMCFSFSFPASIFEKYKMLVMRCKRCLPEYRVCADGDGRHGGEGDEWLWVRVGEGWGRLGKGSGKGYQI